MSLQMPWYWTLAFSLVLLVVSVYAIYRWDLRAPLPGLNERMKEFARQAIKLAKSEYGVQLDYSVESLPELSQILDSIHERHRAEPIPDKILSQTVLTWGSYLGAVLLKQGEGKWETNSLKHGANTFPLLMERGEAIPVLWCLQHIRHGNSKGIEASVSSFLA
jgi:hypothetical protein